MNEDPAHLKFLSRFSLDLRTSQNALAVVEFIMFSISEVIFSGCQTPTVSKPRCFDFSLRINKIQKVDELFDALLLSNYN